MSPTSRLAKFAAALRGASKLELRGKVVLITGGSRGLGLELARCYLKDGARVAICARTAIDVELALRELAQRDVDDCVLGLVCDVTDRNAIASAVATVAERWNRLDVLVNNAGTITVGPVSTMNRDDYEHALATHFWGPLDVITAVLPHLRAAGGGRIVNISSIGGKIAVPHLLPYSASKFALTGLSTGLHSELARENIFVTTVHPGLMRTGSPVNASFKGQNRLEYAWFAVSDSLPILSMNASRAAKQIVRATTLGTPEIVLSLPAKLGAALRALAPNFMARMLAMTNELLPDAAGDGSARYGFESESAVVPSVLTTLTQQAEKRNNETTHRRAMDA